MLLDDRSPRQSYIRSLTTDSLQSAEELDSVCTALGVTDAELRKRIQDARGAKAADQSLRQLFIARNQIIHEFDLQPQAPTKAGDRRRRERTLEEVQRWASEGLDVAQCVINDVARRITDARQGR